MAKVMPTTRSFRRGPAMSMERFTIDEVVFAEPGELLLLGARTLEGLNLTIDTSRKRLVAAGPVPVA